VKRAAQGLLARANSSPDRWFRYLHERGDDFSAALMAMRHQFDLNGPK
jgi:hypothetical protein